ncbi:MULTISPECIES: bi-domain-containing oxidoreductase [Methylosinus]|uniref:Oxidoreductase n=1 Tax=Methylosinus trichosporium (strain ATCC 35070 / NCIMB 11131 / UNIQEM 75 / OB3b) TaxID=595536 RepID=A0A2D2CV69_METT3|nr:MULTISPECIES: bi-domain-containing oxidoreductase [Methylosinus]ATQ66584.1 oxidoreductase [Methylosinus trichosporium OB3b]OBS54472.1 oxidoreductase [Methylosinus sp. 3S-1]
MKQIRQNYRSGELALAEVPAPRAGAGALLVATRVSLISSGTERQTIELAKASLAGKAMARPDLVRRVIRNIRRDGLAPTVEKVFAKLDTPIPLGYSIAGEALEIGRHVENFRVGDRVACAGAGFANHAEIDAIPKNLVVRVPDGVDDEEASFVTLGAIALQGVRQAQPTLGECFVVMGLGLIGLLTVQLLKANGCRVLGYDPDASRVALARELGADLAVGEGLLEATKAFTRGHGADGVILAASTKSSEPLNIAAEISRMKGRIVVVGLVGMTIDREPFYKRELDLRLSMSYGPGRHDPGYEFEGHDYPLAHVRWTEQRNMEAFLALVAERKVTPKALVTHRFPIAEALAAYALMQSGAPHLAITLHYPREAPEPTRMVRSAPAPQRRDGEATLGFIGFGNYAKSVLLPAFSAIDGVRLAAVATSTGLSAGHAAEKHGFAAATTDADALIDDAEIDALVIATRHDTHADYARRALIAGKHVFVEKPLALTREELRDVAVAAEAAPGVLTVGFNRRFAPLLIEAKRALEPRSGPLVMLYRVNAGEIPAESWIQRGEGGGRIIGEVCHFVDALTYLCGALPIEAQATAARDHDDAVSALLRFADGSTGAIVYSSLGDPAVPKERIEIFAAGRVVQLDDFTRLDITRGGRRRRVKAAQDKGQRALARAFIEATRGRGAPPIPLAELIAVSEATLAIEEAVRE